MGILIQCAPHEEIITGPTSQLLVLRYPVPIELTLTCDEPTALLCVGEQTFRETDGFIADHAAAMKAGWLERYADRGRLWICPACSGKKS